MRIPNWKVLVLVAGALGNVHAQSLRSGGCSDLYGTAPAPAVQQSQDKLSDNEAVARVHLVGFGHHGHHGGHSCLFKRGGCSVGSCGAPVPYGLPAAGFYSAPLVANQPSTFYQAPTYFQAPGHYQGHGYEYSTPQQGGYYQAPGYSVLQGAAGVAVSGACAPSVSHVDNAVLNFGNTIQGGSGYGAVVVPTQQRSLIDCGPVTSYKVVLEPKYFTETREVPSTEYQNETRYRTRTVPRTVPIETQDYRTITTMVPRSETKTIEYTVLVPQTSEKSVDVVETVPVWNDVSEQYTVRVPTVVEVPEEYKVRVPQLVDQEFTYTVQVPQSQTETRMHTVTNAVPVTRTRTIQVLQPVTRTQTVTKDYGHWETYVEEVAVPAAVSGCTTGGAYSAAPVANYAVGHSGSSCGTGHGCGLLGRHHGCGLFRRGGCGASASSCGAGGCSAGGCCWCAAGGCFAGVALLVVVVRTRQLALDAAKLW